MAIKHTGDFKQEAVRIALSSWFPHRRVALDLGVGQFRCANKVLTAAVEDYVIIALT
ncbi:hypothetical protein [Sphingorhabdus sp.]|jgi:hypothetical protein|uniref:hypothetical protein n=1 Tax=Sphingorhabdus sp. TaxID=1902408 RepID=UPI002620EE53|nr:hypothetical protein [Sphingorhabdus sp.]MDH4398240.1 hypothetical protein [Sphingorhabdus sp.]